jgi:hypothetical protein
MKKFIVILILSFQSLASAQSSEENAPTPSTEESLQKSFQREYVYMTSQKQALLKQKQQVEKNYQDRIANAKSRTQFLQKDLVQKSSLNDEQHEILLSLEKRKKDLQKKDSSLESTYKKAQISVSDFSSGLRFEPAAKKTDVVVPADLKFEDFEKVVEKAVEVLEASTKVESFPGSFLDLEGELTEGTVTRVGRAAAIGSVKDNHYVLGPNGEGQLKALEATSAPTSSSLNLYVFESLHKAAKIQRQGGFIEKLADISPLLFLGLILLLVAGLFGALIKV